ncbi:hypothetical protein [Nonomuraea deserti]|nr:hypothetical protein [Nonomuraea deserti]
MTGEPLSWPTVLAAALIIAGVLYANSRPRRHVLQSPERLESTLVRPA